MSSSAPSESSISAALVALHPARAPARAVVLPGFCVFLGGAGCRTDLLIVPFNSYLQIQFLRCGK